MVQWLSVESVGEKLSEYARDGLGYYEQLLALSGRLRGGRKMLPKTAIRLEVYKE